MEGRKSPALQRPTEPKTQAIGHHLRAIRQGAGMSQRALAKKIGTTASAICRLEKQGYRGHKLEVLRRIAAVFGLRVEVHFSPTAQDGAGTAASPLRPSDG